MENKRTPSDAELNAPWYVSGQLEADEARELEELARQDPELARLLKEMGEEAEAAVALNEALPNPSPQVWRRLEASIEQETGRQTAAVPDKLRATFRSAVAALAGFMESLSGPRWQMVGAALIALCVIQAATIAYLLRSGGNSGKYTVASGPKVGIPTSAAFLVKFSDSATTAGIVAALDDAGVTIVEGPISGGLFRVALKDAKIIPRDAASQKLKSSEAVTMVLPQN
jgi:anti-sigma factor RsiW